MAPLLDLGTDTGVTGATLCPGGGGAGGRQGTPLSRSRDNQSFLTIFLNNCWVSGVVGKKKKKNLHFIYFCIRNIFIHTVQNSKGTRGYVVKSFPTSCPPATVLPPQVGSATSFLVTSLFLVNNQADTEIYIYVFFHSLHKQ